VVWLLACGEACAESDAEPRCPLGIAFHTKSPLRMSGPDRRTKPGERVFWGASLSQAGREGVGVLVDLKC
jgi:hypothetical protein